jgi:TolA-binding protein
MTFKYFMTTLIICLGCSSEKSLETEFQQLQSSITKIAAFKERCEIIIKDPGKSSEQPNAVFYLGRLNELFAHYEEAVKHYRYLLIRFPEHAICSESIYRIGYIYENHLDNKSEAQIAYNQLITLYPASPLVDKALINHAQLSCARKEWQQAMDYFIQYLEHYPQSRIKDDIAFRLADIMQSGIKDTVKAEALYTQFITDYPQSSWRVFAEEKIERIQNSKIRSSGVQNNINTEDTENTEKSK